MIPYINVNKCVTLNRSAIQNSIYILLSLVQCFQFNRALSLVKENVWHCQLSSNAPRSSRSLSDGTLCGHCQRKLHLLLQDLVDVLSVYLDLQNHSSDYKNTSFYPCCPSFWVWCAFLICKQNMLMSYTHVLYFLQSSERNDQFDGVQQNRWDFERQFAYALSSNVFSCCVLLRCLLFVINSAMCIAQLLQILDVMMDFFGFTTKTDHTAAHGKAVIIFDSLVLISVFFVHLSIQKQLIQNVTNSSNQKLL